MPSKTKPADNTAAPQEERPATNNRPAHEVRLGKVKAVVWQNATENGVRHNVTFRRLFKRDNNAQWEQSDSFGRDELPLVMEVARQAWLWVHEHGQETR